MWRSINDIGRHLAFSPFICILVRSSLRILPPPRVQVRISPFPLPETCMNPHSYPSFLASRIRAAFFKRHQQQSCITTSRVFAVKHTCIRSAIGHRPFTAQPQCSNISHQVHTPVASVSRLSIVVENLSCTLPCYSCHWLSWDLIR